jgi:drug/metabolite transporter (DMT)-like permease
MHETTVRSNSLAPHFALFAVQMMFGSFPVVGKFVLQAIPPLGIVAFRVCGAALAFYVLQKLTGSVRLERRGDYARVAVYTLLGVVFNQLLFIKGLSLTTATNTSLLAVTIPVFAAIVGAAFGYDRLNWKKSAGILLAALGVVYLIDPASASFSSDTTRGDILIVLNCVAYASYIAVSKETITRNGALRSIAWMFVFGSVICLPLGLWALAPIDLLAVSAQTWLAIAFLVLIPTIGAYYLNAWAIARVAPSTVAVYIYLQPLIGFFLAVAFLGETLNFRAFAAMFLIFVGVYLVTQNNNLNDERATHLT